MNKLLKLSFVLLVMLSLCACSTNELSIRCTLEEDNNEGYDINSKSLTIYEAQFDENKNLKSFKATDIETAYDMETYRLRKNDAKNMLDPDYVITFDDNKKTITTVYEETVNLQSLTDQEIEDYNMKNYVESLEGSDFTCEVKGTTRQELGLE